MNCNDARYYAMERVIHIWLDSYTSALKGVGRSQCIDKVWPIFEKDGKHLHAIIQTVGLLHTQSLEGGKVGRDLDFVCESGKAKSLQAIDFCKEQV